MKSTTITHVLLGVIALGLFANVLSHPREVKAAPDDSYRLRQIEDAAESAKSAAEEASSAAREAVEETKKILCGRTNYMGQIIEINTGLSMDRCVTLPDLKHDLK